MVMISLKFETFINYFEKPWERGE